MKNVALIGYSGHAYVVADIFLQLNYSIIGYFEKNEANYNPFKLKYLGNERETNLKELLKKGTSCFVSIGDNAIRSEVIKFLNSNNIELITAISPKANVSPYAEINSGSLISTGACINAFAKIGNGVIINTGAIVEHECNIGDFSHIAPGAVLAGNVFIGPKTFIGANSVIKQGVNIGNNVIVGAGAVVLGDIPDNETWAGNPAKKLTQNG
ncbi:MAG: acetyltransferase [Bacteroidales bacterium]|nr:acetyltransferase [Bacteroidales bacterium]